MPNFLLNHLFFCYLILFLLSLIIGIFLNKVIVRLPLILQQQWQHEARLILNLPNKISEIKTVNKHYFLIEIVSALLSIFVVLHFGITLQTVFALLFTWALLLLFWIDLEHLLLPDNITLPLLWLGLLINLNDLFADIYSAVIGASVGYIFLWLVAWIFKKLTGKTGMGQGDFKLFAACGAWFGWQLLPYILLIAAVTGTIISTIFVLLKKQQRDKPIPFGTYLALAGWCVLLWNPFFLSLYLNN